MPKVIETSKSIQMTHLLQKRPHLLIPSKQSTKHRPNIQEYGHMGSPSHSNTNHATVLPEVVCLAGWKFIAGEIFDDFALQNPAYSFWYF